MVHWSCSVVNCKNNWRSAPKIKKFRFPTREKWILALKRLKFLFLLLF